MKKVMGTKISIGTLLTIVLIFSLSMTLIAATPTSIKAILSPDVTVKYNGATQVLKDGNGATIYPILYNGSTYLPVRAISELVKLPIAWESSTRTVILGENIKEPVSLQDVTKPIKKEYSGFVASWVSDASQFDIKVDDFGNPVDEQFKKQLKMHRVSHFDNSLILELTKKVDKLDAVIRCPETEEPVVFEIFNPTTGDVLFAREMTSNSWETVSNLNITGLTSIGFRSPAINISKQARDIYIYDPIVK